MFFRRRSKRASLPQGIEEGARYRRFARGQGVETAHVIAVCPDLMGIPHVRFWVHHELSDTPDDLRTLALSAFAELFPERIAA